MDQYETIDGLRWSALREILRSPRAYRHALGVPRTDTASMLIGRAIHCALLEPGKFDARYAELPAIDRRTREGKAAYEALASSGRELLTADQWAVVQGAARAVREHSVAHAMLEHWRPEQIITWRCAGRACKARLDAVTDRVIEIKTTRFTTLSEIDADCARRHYHGQCAWYHDGAIAAGLLPADAPLPALIVVTTAEPHDVVVLEMSQDTLDAGRLLVADAFDLLTACEMRGEWPGLAPEPEEWELPAWARWGAYD